MNTLIKLLKERLIIELKKQDRSGIYGYTQKTLSFNSNKIEGSRLNEEQTAYLFETGALLPGNEIIVSKDIEEMNGHFAMFNKMLQTYKKPLSEYLIKSYHYELKIGVFEDRTSGYPIGEYKNRANRVSDIIPTKVEDVHNEMSKLISWYNSQEKVTLKTLAIFHEKYEHIHPFQDGNGRTGRIILFKECLRNDILPFIIRDKDKLTYYKALKDANDCDFNSLEKMFKKEQQAYKSIIEDLCVPRGERKSF